MITSNSNEQIKNMNKLMKSGKERKEQGVYLVEGVRMFREIPREELVKFYITEDCRRLMSDRSSALQPHSSGGLRSEIGNDIQLSIQDNQSAGIWNDDWQEGTDYEFVSDSVMRHMADTQTPQGVIAIVRQKNYTREDIINVIPRIMRKQGNHAVETESDSSATDQKAQSRCILLLEHLQDPGNLGTILRTAEGAGVAGILMSQDTADIYNPKVVRATMGSIFRVPFCYVDNILETVKWLKTQKISCCAAHLDGTNLYQQDFHKPTCFLIGNEGNGLTDALTDAADVKIRIPMAGQVESLNAATAATVLMYEYLRQNDVCNIEEN